MFVRLISADSHICVMILVDSITYHKGHEMAACLDCQKKGTGTENLESACAFPHVHNKAAGAQSPVSKTLRPGPLDLLGETCPTLLF